MTFEYENAVKELKAKDEIRELVFIYCEILDSSNIVATASGSWMLL